MSKIFDAPVASSTTAEEWNGDVNAGFSEFQEETRKSVEVKDPPEAAQDSDPDEPAGDEPVKPKQEPLTDEQKSAMKRANNEKRWDKLLRERDEAKAEVERLKASKPAEPAAPATAKPKIVLHADDDPNDPRPKQGDFTDFDEYVDARSSWNARHVIKAENAKQAAAMAESETVHVSNAFMDEVAEYAKDHPALVGTKDEPGHLTVVGEELEDGLQEVSKAIFQHEQRIEIIDYLGSHPEALNKLVAHRGNQVAALIELGRIMASEFDTPAAPAQPSPVRRLPKPPAPVPGRGHTPSGEAALDAAAEANDFSAFQKTLRARERRR